MTQKIFTIIASIFLLAAPFTQAKEKETKGKEEMHLATVSKTNPFEIVPAAGMEILGDIDDGQVDFAMVEDLLKYARKFMGTRYVSGGKTPKGFDCSGFTSYVFRQFGINLSTSSSGQYGQGSKVHKGEVQPGDLVFFTGRASKSGRVGHVGIAVDSDPVTGVVTFIHAARTGIQIDKTSAPYYSARYLGARRVVGQ